MNIIHTQQDIKDYRKMIRSEFLNTTNLKPDLKGMNNLHGEMLIALYDYCFFDNYFSKELATFKFAISKKLTSSAGNIRSRREYNTDNYEFKISVSAPLILFNDFETKEQWQNGKKVTDVLDALMYTIEHELIHAYEQCKIGYTGHNKRFRIHMFNIFGHTEMCHGLKRKSYGNSKEDFHRGQKIIFQSRQETYHGIIQRCNPTRATVFVPSNNTRWRVHYSSMKIVKE